MVNYQWNSFQTNHPPAIYPSGSPVLVAADVTNFTAAAGSVGSGDPTDVITATDWSNISTSNWYGSSSATVSDIGADIELSIESDSANTDPFVKVNGTDTDNPCTVSPDDTVSIYIDNAVASSQSGNIYVYNITNGGALVDTVTFSLGAKPSGDYVPNAVNWGNIINTGSTSGTNTNQTISGINTSIQLSWTASSSSITITASKNGGSYVGTPITVNNGDTVRFRASNTAPVSRTRSVTIYNVTDHGTALDSFNVSLGGEGFD